MKNPINGKRQFQAIRMILFCLVPFFIGMTNRYRGFVASGLKHSIFWCP